MSNEILLFFWILANLTTGLAYYHIPYEIWRWVKGHNLRGLAWIAWMFVAFIFACGTHHLVMLRTYSHHPIDALQVAVDASMAVVSVAVSTSLIRFRSQIRAILHSLV